MVRYGLSGWMQHFSGGFFPFGTLAVNVPGSFIIGPALQTATGRFVWSLEARLLLTTGFCGGLTTLEAVEIISYPPGKGE